MPLALTDSSTAMRWISRALLLMTLSCASNSGSPGHAQGGSGLVGAAEDLVSFEEAFALAEDRRAVLERLLPRSDEAFFYRCLQLQHTGRLAAVPPLLSEWAGLHGRTARVVEIEHRQALLDYDRDRDSSVAFLTRALGLRFDHEPVTSDAPSTLPSTLEQAPLAFEAFLARATRGGASPVDAVTEAGLVALARSGVEDRWVEAFLRRVQRPDVPGLVDLVVRDLGARKGAGFGRLPVHGLLTLEQLEQLAAAVPGVQEDAQFVQAKLQRLAPSDDADPRRDASVREAHLARLEAYVTTLGARHDSLKAHVLFHRLAHDLALGEPDLRRFLAFLALPHVAPWGRDLRNERGRRVDESASFPTGYEPIGFAGPLVRAYLEHFLRDAESPDAFGEWLDRAWLRRVFVETKILAGVGDRDAWFSMLGDESVYEELRDRVELDFAPTQPDHFSANEPVVLDVRLKNVETLLVKVFEIDARSYFRAHGRTVDPSIQLDGLVPNAEEVQPGPRDPLLREARRLEFPELARPGVFVVELVGGGLSSRAVITKGALAAVERAGAAGHVFRVFDEDGAHVRDAALLLGGREFAADERGEVVLPYASEERDRSGLLVGAGASGLVTFRHRTEEYALAAGGTLEREELVSGGRATLLVRPRLSVHGVEASLALLEDVTLRLVAVDVRGVETSVELRDLALDPTGALVHEFPVPEDVVRVHASLTGSVERLADGERVGLRADVGPFTLNAILATDQVAAPILVRSTDGYALDLLGRNGEPLAGEPVRLKLWHRDFMRPHETSLATDASGRVRLGALVGVARVSASGLPGGLDTWSLEEDARTRRTLVHGVAGRTVRVPYTGDASDVARGEVALFERRGEVAAHDRFDALAFADGFLELRGLAAGDYELRLGAAGDVVHVRVAAEELADGWARGGARILSLAPEPLHVTACTLGADGLEVRLANAGPEARVHVLVARTFPAFDALEGLRLPQPTTTYEADRPYRESSYHAGREIGAEYRYILARRRAERFPGVLLPRPGLLLNPWALRAETDVVGLGGGAGGKFGGRFGGSRNLRAAGGRASERALSASPGRFPALDFLGDDAVVLANLRPDADGVVRVPAADLGPGQHVRVVAVDHEAVVQRTLVRAERPRHLVDVRLVDALAPSGHTIERRRIEFVDAGAGVDLATAAGTRAETFDTLGKVFQLYRTLSADQGLAEFAFLLGWPALAREEKLALYSEHACHELHFFLFEKDRAFFDGVVRPYLANKYDKTFLDRWLLEEDLTAFLEPFAFSRLNVVERILLARRLAGEGPGIARLVRDLVELLPPDPASDARRFDRILAGDALAEGGALRGELAKRDKRPARANDGPELADELESLAFAPPAAADAAPQEEAEEADLLSDSSDFFLGMGQKAEDAERRKEVQRLYRPPSETKVYAEHNYWHRPIEQQDADLVVANRFWRDFAEAPIDRPFVSSHFAEATRNVAEMLFALAVLDLPFEAGEHAVATDGGRLRLEAASPLLLVRRELTDVAPDLDEAILVGQQLVRLDDRFEFVGGVRREKPVRGEFVTGVPYACRVVATNPTSTPVQLEVLCQVPAGAVPLSGNARTRGVALSLDAFGTASHEYAFYFPEPGEFGHFPAHAAADGRLVAFAPPATLGVVDVATEVDLTAWPVVADRGDATAVLDHLRSANLQRIDLPRIAWRMRDAAFAGRVWDVLDARHVYDHVLWSYALRHGDAVRARQFVERCDGYLAQCGSYLASPLAEVDPVERRTYQVLEFAPLVHARAHPYGDGPRVAHQELAAQLARLFDVLAHRPRLDADDWLAVAAAFLAQDRHRDALDAFAKVERDAVAARVQYDYLAAYLALVRADAAGARAIAERHAAHPVERWRTLFGDVLAQLDEAAGAATGAGSGGGASERGGLEPVLELVVEGGEVRLRHRALASCEVGFFETDVEFLFSSSPFGAGGADAVAYVRPNEARVLELDPAGGDLVVPVPASLAAANLVVEVRSGGLVRRAARYANALDVDAMQHLGQLRATRAGAPLPAAYVKVYARQADGSVVFHKDGYTDLRGRFDYVSLTGPDQTPVERFAVLVLHDEHGAVVRELEPPIQ